MYISLLISRGAYRCSRCQSYFWRSLLASSYSYVSFDMSISLLTCTCFLWRFVARVAAVDAWSCFWRSLLPSSYMYVSFAIFTYIGLFWRRVAHIAAVDAWFYFWRSLLPYLCRLWQKRSVCQAKIRSVSHCNTLQHTATHCRTLQHTQHTATRY